jgi:hypothetical protein
MRTICVCIVVAGFMLFAGPLGDQSDVEFARPGANHFCSICMFLMAPARFPPQS